VSFVGYCAGIWAVTSIGQHDQVLSDVRLTRHQVIPGTSSFENQTKLISAAASFLIGKLITITAAITAISAITATVAAAVTAAVTAAIPAATIDTAWRGNINLAAGRRRRRHIHLAAAAAAEIAAAPIRDGTIATGEVAKCFGSGRKSGGNECERCGGHDG
jgi:hypothetical protein